jgi:RHS repeat-associated protein
MLRGGQTYRFILDERGSVRLVVDSTTGAIVQRIDYDAFGRVTLNTNPGFQPFGFAGGLYDEQTGLVHFGVREYDAATGRWITKDPLLFDGGETNLYRYAGDDPVNFVDPAGQETLENQELAQELNEELEKAEDAKDFDKIRRITRTLCHRAAQVVRAFNKLESWGFPFQRHHILQNAEMEDLALPGYSRGIALAIPLMGGRGIPGSPHDLITELQNKGGLGILETARKGLELAGCAPEDVSAIMDEVQAQIDSRGWIIP